MKKSSLFLLSILSPLFLSAQTAAQNAALRNFNARLTKLEKEMKSRKWYNPPAGAQTVEGYHLFAVGEFLWWRAEEDGLTYTYKTDNPTGVSGENDIRLEEMKFKWHYGYRVGGGFKIPHDQWDVYFCWTHLDADAKKHKNADSNEGLFPYWSFPSGIAGGDFFSRAEAHWKLFLNLGDGELGKDFFVGKRLSMRPFLGARTAWINQEYKIEYENAPIGLNQTLNDTVKMKCDYWGLGPRAGVDLRWWVTNTLNIFGAASINLLYGEFRIKQREEAEIQPLGTTEPPLHFNDSYHIARPITDLAIGFGWDNMFFDDRLHIGVKVGWEQHIFFDQNQFIRFVSSSTNSLLSNRGDLALEGLTASLRLDF
jgi:hypothetical protein